MGDISEVKDQFGNKLFIVQQDSIYIHKDVTGSIQEYTQLVINPYDFEAQLSYNTYHGTGLYEYETLMQRHQYVFRY